MWAVVLLLCGLLPSCVDSDTTLHPQQPTLNEPFTLAIDQTVVVEGPSLAVTFAQIVADVRWCDEPCIDASLHAALIRVRLGLPGREPEDRHMWGPGTERAEYQGYVVSFEGLSPEPISTGRTGGIPRAQYKAVLRVTVGP